MSIPKISIMVHNCVQFIRLILITIGREKKDIRIRNEKDTCYNKILKHSVYIPLVSVGWGEHAQRSCFWHMSCKNSQTQTSSTAASKPLGDASLHIPEWKPTCITMWYLKRHELNLILSMWNHRFIRNMFSSLLTMVASDLASHWSQYIWFSPLHFVALK